MAKLNLQHSSVEAKPVLWMRTRTMHTELGIRPVDVLNIIGYQDQVGFVKNADIFDRTFNVPSFSLGCMDNVTVLSTLSTSCFITSIDGTSRELNRLNTIAIDRSLRSGFDFKQLQDYGIGNMLRAAGHNRMLQEAFDISLTSPIHKFLYFVNSTITNNNRANAPKNAKLEPALAANAIYLLRTIRFIAPNDAGIKKAIEHSSLPEELKQDLFYVETERAIYDQLEKRTLQVMLVYKLNADDFHNRKYLLEKTNGVFLCLEGSTVIEHPYSAARQNGQSLAIGDGTRFAMNAQIIYGSHPPPAKFINIAGAAFEVSQKQDITKPEGYYSNYLLPAKEYESEPRVGEHFLPLEDLTEDNGFYTSFQGAKLCLSKEQLARRKERFETEEKATKDLLAARIAAQELEVRCIEQASNSYSEHLTQTFKAVQKEAEILLKDVSKELTLEALKEDSKTSKLLASIHETSDSRLRATKDQTRSFVEEARREQDILETSKRDYIELLRLVPVVLGSTVAIINFMKGSKVR